MRTRFRILREIGAGASGVVYEAFDRDTGMRVALKALKSADADALYRFKREFRALQGVRHANLARLYELVVDGPSRFFTMDLVVGTDFATYVRRDEPRLRRAFEQLARGLCALHAYGKIHRDLKPSNVLVRPDGHLVVVDFGLVFDEEDPARSSLAIVGTPAYMAPEQVIGLEPGPAADWYAAGVMLYEALTGRLPHDGGVAEMLEARRTVEPPAPSTIAQVPRDLDRLCVDLLRIDPELRPRGREVLARLADAPRPRRLTLPLELEARRRELAMLDVTVRRPREGRLGAACLHGPTGCGKSAMLRHTAAVAALDPANAVVSVRCGPGERVAFRGLDGVIDGLSRVLCELSVEEQLGVLSPDAGVLLAAFPVLARVPVLAGVAPTPSLEDPTQQCQVIIEALVGLLGNLARHRHLVFVLDELDHADTAALCVLRGLVRHARPPPLALLLAARDPSALGLPKRVHRIEVIESDTIPDDDVPTEELPAEG